MHYYTGMYMTCTEQYQQYCKRIRELEKEYNYIRNIVCSVPEKEIKANSVSTGHDERWEPG